MKLKFPTVLFLFALQVVFAQHSKFDSLLSVLKKDKIDSSRITELNTLAWEFHSENLDTAMVLSTEALHLSEKIIVSSKEGTSIWIRGKIDEGTSENLIGSFYDSKGEFVLALQFYSKALTVWEDLEKIISVDQRPDILNRKSKTLGSIGFVYFDQGDYPKALDHYFNALRINEELGNKNGIATKLGNIGLVYNEQGDYPKALDYFLKALKIGEELNKASDKMVARSGKSKIAAALSNIGIVYFNQKNYSKSLDYYTRASKMAEEMNNKPVLANNLGNIGNIYKEQASLISDKSLADRSAKSRILDKAIDFYLKSLKIHQELGDKNGISVLMGNIGSYYIFIKKYDKAEKYLLKSISIAEEIGSLDDLRAGNLAMSDLYSQTRRDKEALAYYKKAMVATDSIFSQSKSKEITRKEMNYEFDKKEAAAKAEQEKKDAIATTEKVKQKIVLIFISCVLFLVIIFAIVILRSLRLTQSQKYLIETKNKETEEQKIIIEEKNKNILDSIRYAKRIQQSLLPTEKYIERNLKQLNKN